MKKFSIFSVIVALTFFFSACNKEQPVADSDEAGVVKVKSFDYDRDCQGQPTKIDPATGKNPTTGVAYQNNNAPNGSGDIGKAEVAPGVFIILNKGGGNEHKLIFPDNDAAKGFAVTVTIRNGSDYVDYVFITDCWIGKEHSFGGSVATVWFDQDTWVSPCVDVDVEVVLEEFHAAIQEYVNEKKPETKWTNWDDFMEEIGKQKELATAAAAGWTTCSGTFDFSAYLNAIKDFILDDCLPLSVIEKEAILEFVFAKVDFIAKKKLGDPDNWVNSEQFLNSVESAKEEAADAYMKEPLTTCNKYFNFKPYFADVVKLDDCFPVDKEAILDEFFAKVETFLTKLEKKGGEDKWINWNDFKTQVEEARDLAKAEFLETKGLTICVDPFNFKIYFDNLDKLEKCTGLDEDQIEQIRKDINAIIEDEDETLYTADSWAEFLSYIITKIDVVLDEARAWTSCDDFKYQIDDFEGFVLCEVLPLKDVLAGFHTAVKKYKDDLGNLDQYANKQDILDEIENQKGLAIIAARAAGWRDCDGDFDFSIYLNAIKAVRPCKYLSDDQVQGFLDAFDKQVAQYKAKYTPEWWTNWKEFEAFLDAQKADVEKAARDYTYCEPKAFTFKINFDFDLQCGYITKAEVVNGSWQKNLQDKNNKDGFVFTVALTYCNGIPVEVTQNAGKINAQQKGNKTFTFDGYSVKVTWNDNNMVTGVDVSLTSTPSQPAVPAPATNDKEGGNNNKAGNGNSQK